MRVFEYIVFKSYRSKGYNYVNITVIADESSSPFLDTVLSHKEWGYRIVLIFSDSVIVRDKYRPMVEVLPEKYGKVLYDYMEIEPIDEVLYVKDNISAPDIRNIVRSCEELGVIFRLYNKETEYNLTNAFYENIGDFKFLTFINVPYKPSSVAIKTIMDVFISGIAIIILSPILLLIALSVLLTSRGPVIFTQERIGLRGRPFKLYKFRTMYNNADTKLDELLESDPEARQEYAEYHKLVNDPRVTPVGKVLRRYSLDELPQLINVVKGDMNLIGPRSYLPRELPTMGDYAKIILKVKPGLTGWWQVMGRNATSFKERLRLDEYYISNWSIWLDIYIIIKTIWVLITGQGL